MNRNLIKAIDAKSNPIHMGMIALKIGGVMFQGPFFTYFDRSCIGFLTQVKRHNMLRKREIKVALLKMISTLCKSNVCFFNCFDQCTLRI